MRKTAKLSHREELIADALAGAFSRPADVVEGLYKLTHSFDKTIIILELGDSHAVRDEHIRASVYKWENDCKNN